METIERIADIVNDTRWGIDFSGQELSKIEHFFELREFGEGELVFSEGDASDFVAYIVDGEVGILKGGGASETPVVTLKPRSHFGELSFIDSDPRSATAVASAPTRLLLLSKERFEVILERHPEIAAKILMNVARIISRRLRMTTGRLYCSPFFKARVSEWSGL